LSFNLHKPVVANKALFMKKIIVLSSICIIFWACANEGQKDSSKDSVNISTPSENTLSSDTLYRRNDTSSYERMPQKSDSVPR
jgi:hypothetical protein